MPEQRKRGPSLIEGVHGYHGFYPLATLQTSCPAGVDPTHKEMSLSEEEFKKVFGVEKSAFDGLKAWK